jgi:hypothetical protein
MFKRTKGRAAPRRTGSAEHAFHGAPRHASAMFTVIQNRRTKPTVSHSAIALVLLA